MSPCIEEEGCAVVGNRSVIDVVDEGDVGSLPYLSHVVEHCLIPKEMTCDGGPNILRTSSVVEFPSVNATDGSRHTLSTPATSFVETQPADRAAMMARAPNAKRSESFVCKLSQNRHEPCAFGTPVPTQN
jgi:hypothetical protein